MPPRRCSRDIRGQNDIFALQCLETLPAPEPSEGFRTQIRTLALPLQQFAHLYQGEGLSGIAMLLKLNRLTKIILFGKK